MLSDSDLQILRQFIAGQCASEAAPLDRLWAGRCAALLEERQRLQQLVENLTREVDTVLDSRGSDAGSNDTWVI